MPLADAPEATPRCNVCAQPSKKLKCSKCKTPYCSVACQVLDWKSRGHKAICKRLVKEAAERGEAPTPPPSPKPKAVPPVVEGPARRFIDVARARARGHGHGESGGAGIARTGALVGVVAVPDLLGGLGR